MLLAGLAHTLGGGHLPNPAVLTMTAVLLGLVATTATARRCRFPLLVTLLGVEQILLHLWLTAAVQAEAVCAANPVVAGGGHVGHTGAGPGCVLAASPAAGEMAHGYEMWVAHAVATVLTAWLLARGEAWWWRTVDRIVRAAFSPVRRLRFVRPEVIRGLRTGADRSALSPAAPRGPPVLIVS